MRRFQGTITALITPLNDDLSINYYELDRLAEYQAEHSNGIVVAGTTGQSPTMHIEQGDINHAVIRRVNGRVPVIAGASTYDTEESVELTEQAEEDGADATLHVMGYYNKPPQLGVIEHFDRVAEVARKPIIMYNIPPRGAAEYKPETMIYLAKRHPLITGVKEASGDPATEVARRTRELADKYGLIEFLILSGDDDKTYALMSDPRINADGVISVMSNLLPHVYARFTGLLLSGEVKEAKELNQMLAPLNGMVGVKDTYNIQIENDVYTIENDTFRNPAPVHAAAYILGMIGSPQLRPPLVTMTQRAVEEVGRRLAVVYKQAPEFFDPIRQYFNSDVAKRLEPYRLVA